MFSLGIHRRALALAVAATSIVAGGLAAAPASAEGEPVISWPTTRELNPTMGTYPVTTSYDGTDALFVVLDLNGRDDVVRPVASNGTTDLTFPVDYDGGVTLRAFRCPGGTYVPSACARFGDYGYVHVYDEFVASVGSLAVSGPTDQFSLGFKPWPATIDLDWEVVPVAQPEAEPLVSGSISDLEPTIPLRLPGLGTSAGLVHGERYRYQVTFHGSVDPYGDLDGSAATDFEWDGVNEATGIRFEVNDKFFRKQLKDVSVFYPAEDIRYDWRDRLQIAVLHPDLEQIVQTDITVTDAGGQQVWEERVFDTPWDWHPKVWSGRDANGHLVPEGTYDVTVRVVDVRGNEKSFQQPVRVSHEQLVQTTWEKTVRPKPYLVDKYVGRCAALKSPARPGWRKSHGFQSNPACGNPRTQSVSAVYGIYLPRSEMLGDNHYRYEHVRVTTYGGAPRGAKRSYLVSSYWSEYENQWLATRQFNGRVGAHPGKTSNWRVVLGYKEKEHPYILWSAGLSLGAQFDIKSFTITARYWDVR